MAITKLKKIQNNQDWIGCVEDRLDLIELKEIRKIYRKRKVFKDMYCTAYKYVLKEGYTSPLYTPRLSYLPGTEVEMPRSECHNNPSVNCGPGINVASNHRVLKDAGGEMGHIKDVYTIIDLKVYLKDIVCIPTNSDGKFRVCKVNVLRG